jgi:4a-hydroxytetrahydrobiopterin dehydratase
VAAKLAEKKCVPCHGGMPTLKPDEVAPLLADLGAGWRVEEGKKLVKRFKRKDFLDAIAFVDRIGPIAEGEGHHPDLYVRYGSVDAILWTHAVDGLTENDFILAAKIDQAA